MTQPAKPTPPPVNETWGVHECAAFGCEYRATARTGFCENHRGIVPQRVVDAEIVMGTVAITVVSSIVGFVCSFGMLG